MHRKKNYLLAISMLVLLAVSSPSWAAEMLVHDLPIAEGATEVTYVKRRGDVRFKVAADFKTVGQYYARTLTAQQWKKSGRDNLQRSFWVQKFTKGTAKLEVRVANRDGGSDVRLTPKGMAWEEDNQPTPQDVPIPEDATDVEYKDVVEWIRFNSPSDLKSVVSFLSTELEKRRWVKEATVFDLANFVRLKYTYDKSTLEIDVRSNDAGSEVWIRTKGMQWDGTKSQIVRAKKEAERVVEEAISEPSVEQVAAEQQAANAVISLPERKAKPKRGIGDLPKLPSQGTVVMDGKTFLLPHVIAYEVYEYERWATRVLATEKPIKQQSLLARLRKTGTDTDEDDSPPDWPKPYVLVELDGEDNPSRLSLVASSTPGHGSGDDLTGSAIVEDGRARGKVALKEPGSFFEKVYTAEISFDVPVLTRESTAEKRLAGAAKLDNTGKLILGGRTYNLTNAVAYEMKFFDEPMTTIVLSQRPLDMRKLSAALGRKAADEYFEFIPQIKLVVDADDKLQNMSIWADNTSLSGNSSVDDDIVIEDGRARGTARMTEPGKFFDKQYTFELSFDVNVLGKRVSRATPPAGGLAADSYQGLPFPEGYEGMQSSGSRFRKQMSTTVTADVARVVEFYRREMGSSEWGQWSEDASGAVVDRQSARLAFVGPSGSVAVQLKAQAKDVAITLVVRDSNAAQAAGMLPAPGKARLVIGNQANRETVFTVNQREYKIPAGAGARDPKTGYNWEVAPGNYTVEVKSDGNSDQSTKLKVEANQTWGVIFDGAGGFLAIEIY